MTTLTKRFSIVQFKHIDRWIPPRIIFSPEKLPESWSVASVADVVKQLKTRVKVEKDKEYKLIGVKWYGKGTFHRETVLGSEIGATVLYPVVPNALIYNRLFAWKKSFAVVPSEHDKHFVSGEFPQFIVDDNKVLPHFLYLFFTLNATIQAVNALSIGSAAVSRNRFKEELFLEFKFPLPPLDTQRKIVAAWKLAQAEAIKAEDKVIQAVQEIEARFFSDLGLKPPKKTNHLKAFAVGWKDFGRWSVSYNQTAQSGTDITQGHYPVCELRTLLELVQYGTSEKANTNGNGTPVLRINNIKNGGLDLSDLKHIPLEEKTLTGLLLKDGDILIIRTSGSRDLVGTCAVFHEQTDFVFASYLIRLRVFAEKANPDFVSYFLNSELGRQQINAISRQIMQNNINSEELRSLQVPLPPLNVQKKIMYRVEAGREKIRKEQQAAAHVAEEAEQEVERLILGLSQA